MKPKKQGAAGGRRGTYFRKHYGEVRFPIAATERPGLRRGQRGALHAIAAHFSLRNDPAVVTMPTGTGKTVVLALAAFLLRASRVLVITPSRLVRNQIAEEFASLQRARDTGALATTIPLPAVKEVANRVSTPEAWKELASFDVIVGTPNCVSPALETVAQPPTDFFDLILMDEAHHSPARTWSEILAAFPDARKLLVTATPFRRDRKEIKGTFIFDYPVRQAFEDRVFGSIEFRPVEDRGAQQNDIGIGKATEEILRADREAGLEHFIMVRTDSKARAEELERIYAENIKLNLRRVDSSYSLKYIRKTIDALKNKELDGIIAVDMLGEGFDFPNLKIAAVHSPHKSLAATLQFIGRFARTNAKGIGQAKFVAVVQEIKGSIQELYEEGAEWQDIVPMLNDDRVQDEMETRTVLRDFRQDERYPVDDETKDLSLYGIRPYSHVKIYRVASDLDITRDIQMVQGLEVKHREVSEDGTTVVFLTKEEVQPKWAPRGRFIKVEYDLFIIHIERDTGLVFICTSRRRELVYRHLIAQYAGDDHDILAVEVINRVLNDIDNPEAFSVGMRSRMQASAESYRIMAGPNAAKAIKRTDGRMYHRGHGMFRGQEGGDNITIGLSSASKVWANGYLQIPHLLRWCKHVATKLANEKTSRTNSNWDFLPMPERISVLPDQPAIAVDWDKDVYLEQPFLHVANGDGVEEIPLLDCDLTIDPEQSAGVIRFRVELGDRVWPLEFALTPAATITAASWDEASGPTVEWEGEEVTLPQFLCTSFPTFYFPDFSLLTGRDYLRAVTEGLVFDGQQIEVVDWNTAKVDIRAERYNPQVGTISIHDYLRNRLAKQGHTVVVYDDGSGEVADFVAIDDRDDEVHFTFHHAKGSKGAKPGERVGDVYEVCGQAVKSLRWTAAPPALVDRLLLRSRDRDAERIVVGSRDALKQVRESVAKKKVSYHIVVVQPGISRAALTSNTSALPLASADFFITQAGNFDDLLVIGSA